MCSDPVHLPFPRTLFLLLALLSQVTHLPFSPGSFPVGYKCAPVSPTVKRRPSLHPTSPSPRPFSEVMNLERSQSAGFGRGVGGFPARFRGVEASWSCPAWTGKSRLGPPLLWTTATTLHWTMAVTGLLPRPTSSMQGEACHPPRPGFRRHLGVVPPLPLLSSHPCPSSPHPRVVPRPCQAPSQGASVNCRPLAASFSACFLQPTRDPSGGAHHTTALPTRCPRSFPR